MSPPSGYSSGEERPPYATAEQVVTIREAVQDIKRLQEAASAGQVGPLPLCLVARELFRGTSVVLYTACLAPFREPFTKDMGMLCAARHGREGGAGHGAAAAASRP